MLSTHLFILKAVTKNDTKPSDDLIQRSDPCLTLTSTLTLSLIGGAVPMAGAVLYSILCRLRVVDNTNERWALALGHLSLLSLSLSLYFYLVLSV